MASPFRTVLIFFAIMLSLAFCIPRLQVHLSPQDNSKSLTVSYSTFGADPEQTEQEATSVLENTFSQLKNLKKISSFSGYGHGRVELVFDQKEDIEYRKFELTALIRQVRPQLGPKVSFPVISRAKSKGTGRSNSPVMIYTLDGNADNHRIKQVAETMFKKKISILGDIAEVRVSGVPGDQLTINYDPDKLRAYHLEKKDIISALSDLSRPGYPGQYRDSGNQIAFIRLGAPDMDMEVIQNTLVPRNRDSTTIRLKDLATIRLEEQQTQSIFRINGNNAVNIGIYALPGANIVRLSKKVRATVEEIKKQLPPGYRTSLSYDDAQFLQKEIEKNYQRTAIAFIVLLLFIFMAYRRWEHLLNLLLSLMVNLSLTILLVWYFEVPIHTYTLAGIAIAFGIMIDHGIIMVDYYKQYGNRKVFIALLGATLTTISALLLVHFLPEDQQRDLVDFAMIIIIALCTSLVTNLWFTVGMYNILFKNRRNAPTPGAPAGNKCSRWRLGYQRAMFFTLGYRKSFVLAIVLLFGIPLFMLPEKWGQKEWYNLSIGSEFYQQHVAPLLNTYIGGTFRLFKLNIYENSTNRDLGKTKLMVTAELPVGNTIEQMELIVGNMEDYLSGAKGLDKYITTVSSGQYATIEIVFGPDFENTELPYKLKSQLTTRALDWGGVDWSIYGVGQGFNNAAAEEIPTFRIKMMGYNFDELQRQAELLKKRLISNTRVQRVNIDERLNYGERGGQHYVLDINANMANILGTDPQNIFGALGSMAKQQGPAMNLVLTGKIYPVMLASEQSENFSKWQVLNKNILVNNATDIKLNAMGNISLQRTSGVILKENRQYIRAISFEYMGLPQFGSSFLDHQLSEAKIEMPIGYSAIRDSSGPDSSADLQRYYLIGILVLINYVICAILFENLVQPLVIIATIPISFIGLFLIFYIFDFPFDQGGYAAFIMLGGLVTNSGIFIINDFNALLQGRKVAAKRYNKLLIRATLNRGRTIMLTTIATICGMVPFLFDGQNEVFWFSLAIGTIGGLIFSMLAIFIALPVLLLKKHRT